MPPRPLRGIPSGPRRGIDAGRRRRQDDRRLPPSAGGGMRTYSFTLTLAGVDVMTPEMAEALFEAGCDDSTPGSRAGVVLVHFNREAESLGDALGSAVKDVEKAGYKVARAEVEEATGV